MHGISDRVGSILAQNDIDFELLTGLSDSEMREIGLTLGMRKRLRRALISMSLDRGTSKISASSTIIDPKMQSRMNDVEISEPLYSRTPTVVHPGTRLNKNIFETLHKDFHLNPEV